MYAAVLEIKSWMGPRIRYYEGDTVESIVRQFEAYQDLDCLVSMGRANEGKKGQKEVTKIAAFLRMYRSGGLTLEDLKTFTFNLSVGSFRCVDAAQGDEEVKALKTKWNPGK